MAWQPPEGMDEYLKSTELCDSDNQEIREKVRELIKDAKTPKEASVRIFFFVRDQIIYSLDSYDVRASDTLKKRIGLCSNKTNLQVALLRAAGIPARYHQVVLKKNCLKGIIPAFLYKSMPDKIWFHPWCECYLSEKWISCDSLFDKALYDAISKKGIISKEQIPTIDWDGENDLITISAWMIEDIGTFHSLDDVFRKAQKEELLPKIILQILFRFSNRYTNKLRKS